MKNKEMHNLLRSPGTCTKTPEYYIAVGSRSAFPTITLRPMGQQKQDNTLRRPRLKG